MPHVFCLISPHASAVISCLFLFAFCHCSSSISLHSQGCCHVILLHVISIFLCFPLLSFFSLLALAPLNYYRTKPSYTPWAWLLCAPCRCIPSNICQHCNITQHSHCEKSGLIYKLSFKWHAKPWTVAWIVSFIHLDFSPNLINHCFFLWVSPLTSPSST